MNLNNKKIGIWGFGIVGRSVVRYLLKHQANSTIEVIDSKPLTDLDKEFLKKHHISFYLQSDLLSFLERNEFIIPSPGIDLRNYAQYNHKWIAELDLFAQYYAKPIIAVTGTIGKTSTTHILGQLLNATGIATTVGGNIGIGMLDLLEQESCQALLEVSSFQLELTKLFAPDLAIWTNFFPNHLDRHADSESYFNAKNQMFAHQQSNQQALVPLALKHQFYTTHQIKSCITFFTVQPPSLEQVTSLRPKDALLFIHDATIVLYKDNRYESLIACDQLPDLSYQENWLIVCGALHLLRANLSVIPHYAHRITLPEHRLEKIATINNIDFYNDSKSTTAEATLAAVARLRSKPIHLLLGGISKGVDRTDLIRQLQGSVVQMYCFGKEAQQLHALCIEREIASNAYLNLDDALDACIKNAQSGHQILLSPAGASFDLFENYTQRGDYFKKLVNKFSLTYQ